MTIPETGGEAVAPSADIFGDILTADEQSHFDTAGAHELPPAEPEAPVAPAPATPAAPDPAVTDIAAGDEQPEDNEIVIDADGRVKDKATGRFVPHAALHKERTRRQEIESKYLEETRARATVEGKIEALNAALGFAASQQGQPGQPGTPGAPAAPEAPIDPEEDIFGYVKQQNTIITKLQKQLEDQQAASTQSAEFTQVQNAYVQDAVRFNQDTPDFPDAYKFVKAQMHRELETQGITDADQRENYIKQQEMDLVRNALAQQKSPAQIIYDLATTRGYAKAAAADPAADVAAAAAAAAEKVATIRAVQDQSTSLTGKGAGQTDAGLTFEQMLDMSDDEMFAFSQKSPAAFKKMMQGG